MRHGAGLQEGTNSGNGCDRILSQFWGQLHRLPLVGLGVVNEALGYGSPGHILQAEGLSADLQLVIVELAPVAAFIFHGIELSVRFFDQVGFTDEANRERS